MSLSTARKAVDLAIGLTPPGETLEFAFFGGEPLLRFELLKEVIQYIRSKENDIGISVRLSITTNGTLLTKTVIDLVKSENIDLCVSMDGPPHIHDRNRCYADKRGSAEIVLKNLEIVAEQLDYFQVNAVYGPDTVSFLPETVRFFIDLNVPVVHLNPNVTSAWSPGIGQKVQDIYTQIADEYIRSFRDGREIAINLIDSKIILFLKGGYGAGDRCGMGDTEWAFAPSGNIYPCERFIGEDDNPALRLGNVHTGLDAVRRCLLFKQRERNNKECHACSFRRYCMNWCGCTNYYMTGHVGLPGPFLCASEKAAIRVAEYVLRTLSDLDNELFIDHFLHYLHEADHATASIH